MSISWIFPGQDGHVNSMGKDFVTKAPEYEQFSNMSINWIFPGQGSQTIGMGKDFITKFPQYEQFFVTAEQIVDKPLRQYIWEQSAEFLPKFLQTDVVQPAIYTLECMLIKSMFDKGEKPIKVAGHSLGEYAALFAAGYISFEQGLEILKYRGAAMQNVCSSIESGMIACIFPVNQDNPADNFTKAQKLAEATNCEVANYNSYEQVVLSGYSTNIDKVLAQYVDFGASKAIKLNVAGAYHSSLMKPAAKEFSTKISNMEFNQGNLELICNRTAKALTDVKSNMIEQIYSPVYWQQTIEHMKQHCQQFLEIGPGNVLSKMLTRQQISASTLEF